MKVLAVFALTALTTGAFAQPHHHNHFRRHAHPASPVQKRYETTDTTCATAMETVYELDGKKIAEKEAKRGLSNGNYRVTGESDPVKEIRDQYDGNDKKNGTDGKGGTFYETSNDRSDGQSDQPHGKSNDHAKDHSGHHSNSNSGGESGHGYSNDGGSGLDADFPSGTIPCDTFPSAYGAIPIDWLGTGGWTGVQKCPSYNKGNLISYIETAVSGNGCAKKAFCSYACPVGYEKTQWPSDQGATGQSIGGLYCNDNGMLELSRPEKKKLCQPGAGGVTIQNDLPVQVSSCRTDYPGTESMVIPCVAQGGQSGVPLALPYSPDYYQWQGKSTTAQWYINKKGLGPEKACVWNSDEDHDGRGNWAPVNIGVGKNQDGLTFISIFPNKPTSNADLDYNIEIIGDVNSECKLENGAYTGGGNGCTVS